MAAADEWAQAMLRRIRAARRAGPVVETLRPTLSEAGRVGVLAAQSRRLPARAHLETTGTGLQLRFSGPGARLADYAARDHLAVTLPEAISQMRATTNQALRI